MKGGTLRIGGDGRFGLPLVECEGCYGSVTGVSALVVRMAEEDYPTVTLSPAAAWEAHLVISPTCGRIKLEPRARHGSGESVRWGLGLMAHIEPTGADAA